MNRTVSQAVQPLVIGTENVADSEPGSRVTVRWFSSGEGDRRDALALRYRAYHTSGYIETSRWGIYTDPYDDVPSTVIAGLFRHGACIATLRLCFYHPGAAGPALPCETVYPEVEAIKAGATGTVVELSRLAMDPSITNTRYRARLYAAAVRTAVIACAAFDAQQLLVATLLKSRQFYEHVLGFEVAAPPRHYPPGEFQIILLSRHLNADARQRLMNNIFFKFDEQEIADVRAIIAPKLNGKEQV